MKRAEQWVTLTQLALSLGYATLAFRIDVKLDDEIGPRAFPLLVAGLMILFCLLNLIKLVRETGDKGPAQLGWPEALFAVLGLVYSLLMPVVGYVISTTLFMMGGIRVMGEKRWVHTIAISVLTASASWGLFAKLLGVTLPTSPLGII